MYGITFDGQHSLKDLGVTMAPGKQIGRPSKNKVKISPPFSNQEYDFSKLYGSQTYSNRTLTYHFNILDKTLDKVERVRRMQITSIKIQNWLMKPVGKSILIDDAITGYHFLAEVEASIGFNEDFAKGELTVTFDAYPFMIRNLPEGNDIWDEFNFELDVAQITKFDISGSRQITLYNVGQTDYRPKIIVSSQMQIQFVGNTFTVPAGESESYDFILPPGENHLTITGNGTIEFVYHQEVI